MSTGDVKDLQYSSRVASLKTICQRASIKFCFKREAESSLVSPQICLYLTDVGENRIIFNFTNNEPGTYAIKGIHYHDGGLLGPAVELGHIAGPDAEVRNQNIRISKCLDQSISGDLFSGTDFTSAPNDGKPHLFDDAYCQSESVVNIFDLKPDKGFADTLYALTAGGLCITLQVMDLATHYYMRYINDSIPMIS